jgi:hypothetical protein
LAGPGVAAGGLHFLAQEKTTDATPASPVVAAKEAVIAHHDTIMAQTDYLFELKKKITATPAPTATTAPYLRSLRGADEAMMSWMHQYKAPDSTATEAQQLAYFAQQQTQLDAIGQQQQRAIDSARTFLQHPPAPTK